MKTLEERLSDLERSHRELLGNHNKLRNDHDRLNAAAVRNGLIPSASTEEAHPAVETVSDSIKAVHARGGESWREVAKRESNHGR